MFTHSPRIVTDGLVLCLDAGNTKSYPGSGTTWYDLSGNGLNGTLINSPTFDSGNGGSIVFDGINNYVNFGNILNSPTQLTVNFWIKNVNNGVIVTKGYRLWEIRFNNNEFGGYVGINIGNFWYGIADNNNILHNTNLSNWNNFTYVFDYLIGNIKLYANGINRGNINVSNMSSTYSPTYSLNIGRRVENNSAFMSGNLSIIQLYNKILTPQEILQNYNSLKGRFGL